MVSSKAFRSSSRQGSVDDSDTAHSSSSSGRRVRKRPALNSVTDTVPGESTGGDDAPLSSTSAANERASRASGSRPPRPARPALFETPNEARHRIMSVIQRQSASTSSDQIAASPCVRGQPPSTADDVDQPSPQRNSGPTLQQPQSFSSNLPTASSSRNTRSSNTVADYNQAAAVSSSSMTPSLSSLSNLSNPLQPSNMSPPRPTRSLPRRNASARTLNRPVLSNASTSHVLRSRSASNSTILSNSSSNANILASGHSRQNVPTGCGPFTGSYDPLSNPPSGVSTPRTPLAEIPLWLADLRSESRRSSFGSSSFIDRDDWLASIQPSTRQTPPSPGVNRIESPTAPFRRSQRARHPRQSDENQEGPMSLDHDAFSDTHDASIYSFTPHTPAQGSPAMSTRSRTLGRTSSTRRPRRMTNSLSAPLLQALADQSPGQTQLLGVGVHVQNSQDTSRSSSSTRSPSRATRTLRRRSVVGGSHSVQHDTEAAQSGPHPRPLAPLHIPATGLGATFPSDSLVPEPISPSAFSEMTSLTQGSTAAESSSSSFGQPPTPSSSVASHDRERLSSLADSQMRYTRSDADALLAPPIESNDKNVIKDNTPLRPSHAP